MSSFKNKAEQLAELLQARKKAKMTASKEIRARPTSAPMSDQQKRIWLHEQQSKTALYNLPLTLKLCGQLSIFSLQQTLNQIVTYQDSLRTVFKVQDGVFTQEVKTSLPIFIEFQQALSDNPLRIQRLIQQTICKPFDLETGPLLRLKILQTGDAEWIFILVMHHIISDGYSLKIFLEGLLQRKFEILENQYIDYSLDQQAHLATSDYQVKAQHWQHILEGLPVLRLPTEFTRQSERTYWGKRVSASLPPMLQNLDFQYALSTLSLLLAYYAKQYDFAVGIATLNRPAQHLEKLIGFFANTLPCRFSINPNITVKKFCEQTQQQLFQIFDNQDVAFETLASKSNIERVAGFPSLTQVMYVFREGLDSVFQDQPFTVEYLDFHPEVALFDLLVCVTKTTHGSWLSIDYNADLFSAAMMRTFLNDYLKLLEQASHAYSEKISTLFAVLPNRVFTTKKSTPTFSAIRPVKTIEREKEMESTLTELWKETLKIDHIHAEDSFLTLGGHSIAAVILADKISEIFNIQLPLIRLFDRPTIADLAREIKCLQTENKKTVTLAKKPPEMATPLSFAQEKLWRFHLIEPTATTYHLGALTRLKGATNESILQKALSSLLHQHEAFSIRLTRRGTHGVNIKRQAPNKPTLLDYTLLAEAQKEVSLNALKKQLMTTPYRLDKEEAPWSLYIIKWNPTETLLIFGGHHLFFDAWSFNILIEDFVNYYQSHSQNSNAPLLTKPVEYTDYAYWQRQYADTELQEQKQYWEAQLKNYVPLELLTDLPRKPLETYLGERLQKHSDETQCEAVLKKAIAYHCTPFTLHVSAFALALAYFCGQEDFVFGVPFANRNLPGLNRIVGHFVNVLPLRIQLDKQDTKKQFLQKMYYTLLAAQKNQNIFIEDLTIRVLFNYIYLPKTNIEIADLNFETEPLRPFGSKYDFSFTLENSDKTNLRLIEYNSALFHEETLHFLDDLYQYFLSSFMHTEQHDTIHDLFLQHYCTLCVKASPVHTAEKNTLRETTSLYEAFTQQVLRGPNHPALSNFSKTLTYGELHAEIDKQAKALRALNLTKGQRIGIDMQNPLEIVPAIFAILAADHCYVPLTAHQLEASVNDAQIEWILGEHFIIRQTFPHHKTTFQSSEKLAYILYTSGSTGKPKGVMQSEKNVLQHIANYTEQLAICGEDRLLQITSFNFDAAVMDLYAALLNGCTLYVADVNQLGFKTTVEKIMTHKISIYHSTPSLFRQLFESTYSNFSFPDLRLIVLGGEAVFPTDFELFQKTFSSNCYLINGYGPSECTIAMQNKLSSHDKAPTETVAIGYPMPDTEVYLINEKRDLSGLIGEIAIANPAIATGYWNQPALTEKAFIYWKKTKNFLYLTGDFARRLPDGRFLFLGRRDGQVKVRGFKVNLALIESILKKHAELQNAVIVSEQLINQEIRVHAFYLSKKHSSIKAHDLRLYLEKELPHYMIPELFHEIESLLYTASGKINRCALLQSISLRDFSAPKDNHPKNKTEKILHSLWKQVLHRQTISIDQNFFELGGNSLRLLELHKKMEDQLQKLIPLSALFQHANIRSLSLYLTTDSSKNIHKEKIQTQTKNRINYFHKLNQNKTKQDALS